MFVLSPCCHMCTLTSYHQSYWCYRVNGWWIYASIMVLKYGWKIPLRLIYIYIYVYIYVYIYIICIYIYRERERKDTDTERALLPTVLSWPEVLETVADFDDLTDFDAPNYVLPVICRNQMRVIWICSCLAKSRLQLNHIHIQILHNDKWR